MAEKPKVVEKAEKWQNIEENDEIESDKSLEKPAKFKEEKEAAPPTDLWSILYTDKDPNYNKDIKN